MFLDVKYKILVRSINSKWYLLAKTYVRDNSIIPIPITTIMVTLEMQ